MQEIQGKTRTVRELLSGAKYGIDFSLYRAIAELLWSADRLKEIT